jgi:hypothetical protein
MVISSKKHLKSNNRSTKTRLKNILNQKLIDVYKIKDIWSLFSCLSVSTKTNKSLNIGWIASAKTIIFSIHLAPNKII